MKMKNKQIISLVTRKSARFLNSKMKGDTQLPFILLLPAVDVLQLLLIKWLIYQVKRVKLKLYLRLEIAKVYKEKKVAIFTDDPNYSRYELILEVSIPRIAEINTRFLYWKKDESLAPKSITIDFHPNELINITDIKQSNDLFKIDLNEVLTGKKYIISVDPGTTRSPKIGNLLVKTDFPKGDPKVFFFHLRVQ